MATVKISFYQRNWREVSVDFLACLLLQLLYKVAYRLTKTENLISFIWDMFDYNSLFAISFSHLSCNVIQCGYKAISSWKYKVVRYCFTNMIDYIAMQIRWEKLTVKRAIKFNCSATDTIYNGSAFNKSEAKIDVSSITNGDSTAFFMVCMWNYLSVWGMWAANNEFRSENT